MPCAKRGWAIIILDSSYYLGNFISTLVSINLGESHMKMYFWSIYFGVSLPSSIFIYFLARKIPETPRFLIYRCNFVFLKIIIKKLKYFWKIFN